MEGEEPLSQPDVIIPPVKSNDQILEDLKQKRENELAKKGPLQRSLAILSGVIDRYFPKTGAASPTNESTGKF